MMTTPTLAAPNVSLHTLGVPVSFAELRASVAWDQRMVTVYGKSHPQPRLTRWYGEEPYRYSGLTWEASAMPEIITRILSAVEGITGERFNSVLCNLYRDGSDCIGWHADDEPIFGRDPVVASVSFGAARAFKMRRNDHSPAGSWSLSDGSLFVMGRGVQAAYQHCLPRTAKPTGERINLTFRRTMTLES